MKIILASQSPRRVFLLHKVGLDFDQVPSDFEEYFDDTRSSEQIAKELGLGKANYVARQHPSAVVIGSDLIIEVDGKQLGKPENNKEAVEMLRNFDGKVQKLIASVAVVCLDKGYSKVDVEVSTIKIRGLSERFAEDYVKANNILDRAGGYDFRHPEIQSLNPDIFGRFDTIAGLPTNLVADYLKDLSITIEPLPARDESLLTDTEF